MLSAWRILTSAQAGFEAARQLGPAGSSNPAARLHGHGFVVNVAAELPPGWAPYPGGECAALQQRLEATVEPLNQRLLNEVFDNPSDAELTHWISSRLALPGPARIQVQSTGRQGALREADGSVQHWRRYRFESAHRLPRVPLGHKCGRMHGHGFEAVVHARGADHAQLDEAWAPLHMQLNYQCLNDLAGLENPTSEALAAWLWNRLQGSPANPGSAGVTVFETASCGAHFDGRCHRIWKDFHFDSATVLRQAPPGDPRARLHGHTYLLRLHLQAALDPVMGWAVDFGEVKAAFAPIFADIDHRALDQLPGLEDGDTASAARWLMDRARAVLPAACRLDLFEAPGCGSLLLPAGHPEQPLLPASAHPSH